MFATGFALILQWGDWNEINVKNFSPLSHCICVTFLHWWLPLVMNWKYLDGPLESSVKFINGRTLECSIRYFWTIQANQWKLKKVFLWPITCLETDGWKAYYSETLLEKIQENYETLILEIEISNNGVSWSSGIFLTLYNSTCSTCTPGHVSMMPTICSDKDDLCR